MSGIFHQAVAAASVVVVFVFSANSFAYGGHYFRSLRDDLTIPQHCKDLELDHFEKEKIDFFTYSIEGAKRKGFDHEYPLGRGEAKDLWRYIKRHRDGGRVDTNAGQFRKNKQLKIYFETLRDNYEAMDFDFASEGEVLELLVIKAMENIVGDELYVYGSVQYADRVAGELDLIVARKADCSVFAIGEAKLGVKSLGKARKQLDRFYGFLRSHVRQGIKILSFTPPVW